MEDSLDAYISQSLIDSSSNALGDFDRPNSLSSELLMQLLLNTVGTGAALPDSAATIDPSSLGGMDVDDYALTPGSAGVAAGDTADSNSLLAAALLSALGPLPDIAAAGQTSEAMHGAESMVVDPPVAATETPKARPAVVAPAATAAARPKPRPSCAAPQKQTIQQQALSTAGKRSISAAAVPRPAPKTTTAAPVRVGATAPQVQKPAAKLDVGSRDDEDEDDIDMEGIDMKSLSSKERRQLRNKISARNFRVRRKEYISNLEAEARMHKEEADGLRRELTTSKRDNAQLRDEIQRLRQRLSAMSATQPASAAAATAAVPAPAAASAAAGAPTRTAAPAHPAKQAPKPAAAPPSAPMVRFNPHKDIAQSAAKKGPSAAGGNWAAKSSRSGYIAVNTAMLPPAHSAKIDEVMAETRRKQVVNALLDIDDPAAKAHAHGRCADAALSDAQALAVAAAILGTASIVAELVLPQLALESSLTHVPGPAALPVLSVAC